MFPVGEEHQRMNRIPFCHLCRRRHRHPDLGQRWSSVADLGVASQRVHQSVHREGVVGGPRPHVLLKALNDGTVGPETSSTKNFINCPENGFWSKTGSQE